MPPVNRTSALVHALSLQIEPFLGVAGSPAAAALSAGALAADIKARGMTAAVALAVSTGVEAVLPMLQAGAVDMVRWEPCALGCLVCMAHDCVSLQQESQG